MNQENQEITLEDEIADKIAKMVLECKEQGIEMPNFPLGILAEPEENTKTR